MTRRNWPGGEQEALGEGIRKSKTEAMNSSTRDQRERKVGQAA
jgi:hypothetical protein